MLITQANLNALRVTFEARFQEAYLAAAPSLAPLWFEVPSSTRSNRYGWIAQQLTLRQWIGPRVAQNLSEHEYDLVNVPYEGTVEVDKYDLKDDNLGLYTGVFLPQLGEAVKKHPDVLAEQVLRLNGNAFDGVSLFNTVHPGFGLGTAYANDYTLSLNANTIQTMMSAAASILGEDGQPLEVRFDTIVVPPQLEFAAKQILKGETYAAVATTGAAIEGTGVVRVENQMNGVLNIVVSPKLANAPTTFYLADLSKAIKPLLHQLRDPPEFVSRDNVQDPKVFDLRKFTYGVDLRDNMGVSLPFLIARSVAPSS